MARTKQIAKKKLKAKSAAANNNTYDSHPVGVTTKQFERIKKLAEEFGQPIGAISKQLMALGLQNFVIVEHEQIVKQKIKRIQQKSGESKR